MTRPRKRRDQNLRLHIAYLAARMIAEDGVADYASAKQKAARQAGLSDANLLPDNSEIEEALREYQGLYQSEEQPAHLRHLREVAVKVMRDFEEFRPVLVGSVLNGTAGQHSDVNLQLYTDDAKALTMFLLNRRYRFEEGTTSVRRGGRVLKPSPRGAPASSRSRRCWPLAPGLEALGRLQRVVREDRVRARAAEP